MVGQSLLTNIVGDKDNKRAFISNRAGQVYIYDISVVPNILNFLRIIRKNQSLFT